MNRPIVTDRFALSRPSRPAGKEDLAAARDLLDTLIFNRERCVGMAANMIGKNLRIIAVTQDGIPMVLINPEYLSRTGKVYDTEEGCLCLGGLRPCRRYPRVTLRYLDMNLQSHTAAFSGFTAQIVQHEMDHLEGILI